MLDLQQEFKDALTFKVPKRADLVKKLGSILNIELESVSRRLSGRVQFSINEMAKIANELNISIDTLLTKNNGYTWIPIMLESPMKQESMNALIKKMSSLISEIPKIISYPCDFECIFDSLPFELTIKYRYLLKFMYFKWGHYFVGNDEFINYDSWEIPPKLLELESKYNVLADNISSSTYIWNHSLVWKLVREVEYFRKMGAISPEAKGLILEDIYELLRDLEEINKYGMEGENGNKKSFYICHATLGVNCWSYISDRGSVAYSTTSFSHTSLLTSQESCLAMREWIHSLKKLSTLISGTGNIIRRVFFEEQYNIVDFYRKI